MLKNFFKRRKKTIQEHIEYVDKSKISFQLNIGTVIHTTKQNRIDIQVFKQEIVKDFNYDLIDENGYLLLLSFNDEKYNNKTNYNYFLDSLFFDNALFVNMFGKTYLLRIKNKDELIKSINLLLKDVFKYDNQTIIFTQFEEL